MSQSTCLRLSRALSWAICVAIAVTGCGDNDGANGGAGDGGGDGGDTDAGTGEPICTEETPPQCVDEMILDLSLHDDLVSDDEVSTDEDGDDFVTTVDATAGGFGNETEHPWVYVKFDADGASRVDIDDETALESMDWDLAARRFILRLNGGDSGPSCVAAASFLESTYDDLTEVPDGVEFNVDDYYTSDCTIVNDSSGLPGSPQVALAPWWEYPGCVATTDVPQVIRLADGRTLKIRVDSYYEDSDDQETCNDTGEAADNAVSGVYTLRWKFLP